MKLCLQLAGMLPAPDKADPAEAHGNRAFGTAMEEMMATTSSGRPLLVETPYASLSKQPQSGARLGAAKLDQAVGEFAGNTNVAAKETQIGASVSVVPHPQAPNQSELPQGQSCQGQSNQQSDSSPSEQPSPELAIPGSTLQKTLLQSTIVQNLSAVTLQGDNQKQSLAGAPLPGAASIEDAAPRAKHKTETKADERGHPGDRPLSGASPVILQQINVVIPVPTLQANGPQSVPVASSSKAVGEGILGQNVTRRASFPAMAAGHDALHGTSFTTPGSLTMAQPPGMVISKDGKPPESVPSGANSASYMKTHLASASTEKGNTGVLASPNQAPHPQIAHATDSLETNGRQSDARVPKEAEKGIGIELKTEAKVVLVSPVPTSPAVQHPALPTAPLTVTHDAEKAMAMHRPETSTAQVLQRMDFAGSSGVVLLRADARRLDVGVSSGALGWVEVRATTGVFGRVDATLHVQNDASAQVLTNQSREISDYAREHSVQLGQVSVGVGTGDSTQGQSRSAYARDGDETEVKGTTAQSLVGTEQTHHAADAMSLISVRA